MRLGFESRLTVLGVGTFAIELFLILGGVLLEVSIPSAWGSVSDTVILFVVS